MAFLATAGGVGGLGLVGYAALQALGLLKAGKTAQAGMAAAEAAASVPETGATTEPVVEPTVGATRSYVDDQGTRWIEVFNGQNWTDSATHASQQQQAASNQAWQDEQVQRQKDHDTDFDRERKIRHRESIDRLSEKQAEARHEYKEDLRELQDLHLKTLDRAEATREWAEAKTTALEWSKNTADFGVQAVSSFTGPVGWVGGNAYTMVSELAQGVSQGVGDAAAVGGAGGIGQAVGTVGKEVFNGLATGLCKVAVGETLNAAGAGLSYGVRTVAHRLRHFNPGKAPLAPVFHSPLPGTELVQMAKNARTGSPLMEGVATDFAEMGVQEFRRAVSGTNVPRVSSGLRTTTPEVSRIAHQIKVRDVARSADLWGTLQGIRGVAVDDQVGEALAENLFHAE